MGWVRPALELQWRAVTGTLGSFWSVAGYLFGAHQIVEWYVRQSNPDMADKVQAWLKVGPGWALAGCIFLMLVGYVKASGEEFMRLKGEVRDAREALALRDARLGQAIHRLRDHALAMRNLSYFGPLTRRDQLEPAWLACEQDIRLMFGEHGVSELKRAMPEIGRAERATVVVDVRDGEIVKAEVDVFRGGERLSLLADYLETLATALRDEDLLPGFVGFKAAQK